MNTTTIRLAAYAALMVALVLLVASFGHRLSAVEQHDACVVEYLNDPPGLYRGHKCLSP